jgi:hypothetical protein
MPVFMSAGCRPNRFEATEDVLKALKQRAFNPQLIIDAGANVGDWTRFARTLFPAAECHMIEPQPACRDRLADLERRDARIHLIRLRSRFLA